MATVQLAKELTELGMYVFPVSHGKDNTKKPLTPNGHLDATQDPGVIDDWWGRWPHAKIGVAAGLSGIVVADVDTKDGKDGYDSLDQAGLDLPDTFSYETGTGGSHFVYLAPEGVELNGQAPYRNLVGIDRRGGSSWVMWVGDTPFAGEITPAPKWLCDPVEKKETFNFEGDLQDWYDKLVPGAPNALVRRAMERISPDMGHSEMVEKQHAAIRLGAEGNPGVPALLEALQEAWLNRPAENHTTPEGEWEYKFEEALLSGLEKYGDLTDQLKNLPEYNIGFVPPSIPDGLITIPGGKSEFSRLLGALVEKMKNDDQIASILWNCPATREISREWGLQFVYHRIQKARITPEPKRENPKLEEHRERVQTNSEDLNLLTDDDREYISKRPSFVDQVEQVATDLGYDQLAYFRSVAWTMASLAFGFKGYVPVSRTQKHGLNLWNITIGYSGTGKSTVIDFRDQILREIFENEEVEGVGYDLGADSSIQGLHLALLERDGHASMFATDEASGFFKQLQREGWNTGLEDTLSAWYMGYVAPSNKISLKELRGVSARTSFNVQMFATPKRLTETLTRDQFTSGFLARFNWSIGVPKKDDDEQYDIFKNLDDVEESEFEGSPEVIQQIVSDLISARSAYVNPVALIPTKEAGKLLSEAYRKMSRWAEKRPNYDIVEPAITRLMESMLKCAGICAIYREDSRIIKEDALHAILAVEEWYHNLFTVADMISEGDFQRDCAEILEWISHKGGRATKSAVFSRFKNKILKDPRELESRVNFLVESGELNREESNGAIKYEINGAIT